MRKHSNKLIAGVAGTAAAVALSGVAYAYFTSTGNGSGSGTVGTSTAWEVTTSAATGGPLTPGGGAATDQAVAIHVKNTSTGVQHLATIVVSVASNVAGVSTTWTSQTDTGKPACSLSDFALGGQAAAGSYTISPNVDVAPGATYDSSSAIHMLNLAANQDNCKTVTVPLYVAAS